MQWGGKWPQFYHTVPENVRKLFSNLSIIKIKNLILGHNCLYSSGSLAMHAIKALCEKAVNLLFAPILNIINSLNLIYSE